MTVGELKNKLKSIDDDVKIYSIVNFADEEDDRYDIDMDFELHTRNRDNGYIEIFNYRQIDRNHEKLATFKQEKIERLCNFIRPYINEDVEKEVRIILNDYLLKYEEVSR